MCAKASGQHTQKYVDIYEFQIQLDCGGGPMQSFNSHFNNARDIHTSSINYEDNDYAME